MFVTLRSLFQYFEQKKLYQPCDKSALVCRVSVGVLFGTFFYQFFTRLLNFQLDYRHFDFARNN